MLACLYAWEWVRDSGFVEQPSFRVVLFLSDTRTVWFKGDTLQMHGAGSVWKMHFVNIGTSFGNTVVFP